MLSYSNLHEEASKYNLFFYIPKRKKKKKQTKIWKGKLKTRKGNLGKN